MFCIHCGKANPENSVFCIHCGKPCTMPDDQSAESEIQMQDTTQHAKPRRLSAFFSIIQITVSVLGILVVGAIILEVIEGLASGQTMPADGQQVMQQAQDENVIYVEDLPHYSLENLLDEYLNNEYRFYQEHLGELMYVSGGSITDISDDGLLYDFKLYPGTGFTFLNVSLEDRSALYTLNTGDSVDVVGYLDEGIYPTLVSAVIWYG